MTLPELAPRRRIGGVVSTWAFALVAAVVIGVLAPFDTRLAWMCVGAGASLLFAFVAHLIDGRAQGFIFRVGAATLGALLIMGAVALIVTLASLSAA